MPKIDDNGTIREMTPEEIAELERQAAEMSEQPQTVLEQRIAELEAALGLLLEQFGEDRNTNK